MRLYEMQEKTIVLTEGPAYGNKGFPGYGRGLFRAAYYRYIGSHIARISDNHVREFLKVWFADLFYKDKAAFKKDAFFKFVDAGNTNDSSNAPFQQRHFYYLAHHVKQIEDEHARNFLIEWLGDVAGDTNEYFLFDRWKKECTPDDERTDNTTEEIAPELEDDELELDEWGKHGFPGYGRAMFRRAYYEYMAQSLHDTEDDHVRAFLTDWLGELFAKDHPGFKPDRFAKAVEVGGYTKNPPTFQQRHFYYLAEHVKQLDDPHIHAFVMQWLADVCGRTNIGFNMKTWVKNCTPDID